MMSEIWAWVRHFAGGKRRADVDEEIRFHLEREVEANVAAGMTPEEARRRAAIAFGSREGAREACREARPSFSLELLGRDVRYGLRGLWRNPGFAAVAILTLALAIGANTTIFSLIDQALLQSLPVHDPGQLVVMSFRGTYDGHRHSEGGDTDSDIHEFSYPMYRDLRDRNTVLSGLIAEASATLGVTWNNHAESVSAEMVSGNYFEMLGVKPAVGRLFSASDETAAGANPVAVLSFNYWKTHLGEAPVAGRTLLVNGMPFTTAGVAAPGFQSVVWGHTPDVFVPLTMEQALVPEWPYQNDRRAYWLTMVGRLKPGMKRGQAEAALNTLFLEVRADEFTKLRDQSAKARQGFIGNAHLFVADGAKGFSPMRGDMEMPLTIILAMVLLVIGMAVVNVASLLLVRAATRMREFSVRYALGATSGQIVRQLLAEGMLLGLAGAAAGVAIAPEVLRVLIHWMSGATGGDILTFKPVMDWRVLGWTLAVTLGASLLFSLAPAAQFRKPRLTAAMQERGATGGSGSLSFRRTCVALQIGFSLMLMVAAGLFVRTIGNLRRVNPGFATDHLLAFQLNPALAGYGSSEVAPVEQRVLDAVGTLPGARAAGATNDTDLAGEDIEGDMVPVGYAKTDEEFDVELPWVSNGYLQTMGVPLVAGRYFNAGDTATSTRVAVVNESFAKHYFGSAEAALGHHVARPHQANTEAIVIGAVRDVKHASLREGAMPTCYTLFTQATRQTGLTYYVRTWQAPEAEAASLRAAVAHIDAKLIVGDVRTMTEEIDENLIAERAIALLAGAFGALAALLAGIGLYGILAYSTAQRTREIGIRMALGARRATVVGLILREVLLLAGGAMAVTIPLAMLATRAVRSQLFGVSVADPMVYGAGIVAICVVAAMAGLIPARRAATVDPARALRTE